MSRESEAQRKEKVNKPEITMRGEKRLEAERPHAPMSFKEIEGEQTRKTQGELQWIVAQRLLSALTIPGFK